jgi:glycosyltransferase involved in cell wall biosynthesis
MIRSCCETLQIEKPIHWFYTPMMLPLAEGLPCSLTIYDCMDELSTFAFAPESMRQLERALIARADLMFTGGMALYEAKRALHTNVHGVPSSVDTAFFAQARVPQELPGDLLDIPRPRVVYCGVLDERLDLGLVQAAARARPQMHFVFIGPIAKIDESELPIAPNLHYLGLKRYDELPRYLAHADVGMMPFALNQATRFISPTKTPEYLAAGLPVVSTEIRDVVEPYERLGFVRIARSVDSFIAHLDAAVERGPSLPEERDAFLAAHSWDATWSRMKELMRTALARKWSTPPARGREKERDHV